MNVRRTLLSVNTLVAVLAIFALFVCTGDLAKDVVDSYKGYLDYREMLVFLSTFSVVGLFVQDWHTQVWRLLTVRMPIRRYARNVFLWVWITTLCTAMLGNGCISPIFDANCRCSARLSTRSHGSMIFWEKFCCLIIRMGIWLRRRCARRWFAAVWLCWRF